MNERDIFLEALEMSTPEARAAYLQKVCGRDNALRRKVDELLTEHFSNDSLLSGPAVETERAEGESPAQDGPAVILGPYKLLEKIGEGGFGEVWMAEQREPIKRRVALKIIKPGMDSRQIVARFEAERQALAMMDHPNIAKIFDAGTIGADGVKSQISNLKSEIPKGRPYFVMELVRGIKITEYCDQNQLPTRERLKLFILVCQAIQHAHQKGIIHRDIKPSNILVTLHDGVPVPKVIDFGIAKATQQELTDKTVFTQFQQFMGTPAYISPEQAEMSGLDIDTRADIYSLGVLLYELLVGQTPFDAKEMMQGGLDALRQIIREKEPLRPSTKLNALPGAARTTAGQRRQTEVGKLVHQLQGDLDWIVMTCLEKDRARRYETANALAADIRRHLTSEPVLARPPSRLYEFQKMLRKHRLGFTAAGAVMAALAIGLGMTIWTLGKERQARERAVGAEQAQIRLREEAQGSAFRAEEEAKRAEHNAAEATLQRKHAEALADDNRRNLYAARIKLAAQAITEGDVLRGQELLQGLRPQPGQEELRGFDWYHLQQSASNEKLALTQVGGRVRRLAYSPDGRLLAAACEDGTVRLWDAGTYQLQAQLTGHTQQVAAVAFAPDGKTLASAGADATVRLWNVAEARQVHCLASGTNALAALVFSPGGDWLAAGEGGIAREGNPYFRYIKTVSDGRVLLWNMKTLRLDRVLEAHPTGAMTLVFSPDEQRLVTGGVDGSLKMFDRASGQLLFMRRNLEGPVFAAAFVANQELVAASWFPYDDSGKLTILNAADLERKGLISDVGKVTCLAASPDGTVLACAGADRTLRLWNVGSWKESGVFRGHKAEIWSAAFTPDGRTLATGGFDESIRIWEIDKHPARRSIVSNRILSVAFSPDGAWLAFGGPNVQIREPRTGVLLRTLPEPMNEEARVAFSPDGTVLAASDFDGTVHFWDTETWKHWMPRPEDMASVSNVAHYAPDNQIAFSTDSTTLARAGIDKVIRFWDVRSGKLIGRVDALAHSIGFTPDGTRLLGVSQNDLCIVNAQTRQLEGLQPVGIVGALRISKDGQWLAMGHRTQVELKSLPDLTTVRTLIAHSDAIYCLAFSHDGRILATASWDGTVKLWQIATGQELFTVPSFTGPVRGVAFSPDDRTLAFATSGQAILLRGTASEKAAGGGGD